MHYDGIVAFSHTDFAEELKKRVLHGAAFVSPSGEKWL
jgi:hypothetical protein